MKKLFLIILLFSFTFISFSEETINTSDYKELTATRLAVQKNNYLNQKISLKKVIINSITTMDNTTMLYCSQGQEAFFAYVSDSALDWLLDFSENDNRWNSRYVNIYGTCIDGEYQSFIQIENIELY